ncbi:MAG: c-type cytochrome [Thermoanaerobaculia bacterium]
MPVMRFSMRAALVALICLPCLGAGTPAAAQWPPEVKNLQHFPEDTDFRELMGTMRGFAMGLGVRCQHCHVGEEGQPLATFDFASDEKDTKKKARLMLKMMDDINAGHLSQFDSEAGAALRVQCVTCHRGVARPEQLRDILVEVGGSEGAEAAVAKYRELRGEHYGAGSYDFSETTLIQAAEALAGQNADGAIALLDESLTHTPESSWALGTLAGIEMRRGNTDAAVSALERILEFDPDNERVKQQIQELTVPPEAPSEGGS